MASIVKRGRKFYVVYKYTDQNGAQKQKWESYKTMTEARTRQKEIEYKTDIGSFVVPKCKTMDELLNEYIAIYGRNKWAMSTYTGNVSLIENYPPDDRLYEAGGYYRAGIREVLPTASEY